jgi:hypothetical protein
MLGFNIVEAVGFTGTSVLSFSKSALMAMSYPLCKNDYLMPASSFLYLCIVPAPYLDVDLFSRARNPNFYISKQPLLIEPNYRGLNSHLDDKEIVPIGPPELPAKYILGCWRLMTRPMGQEYRAFHGPPMQRFQYNMKLPASFPKEKIMHIIENADATTNPTHLQGKHLAELQECIKS